jgi:hypothetical protein
MEEHEKVGHPPNDPLRPPGLSGVSKSTDPPHAVHLSWIEVNILARKSLFHRADTPSELAKAKCEARWSEGKYE